MLIPSKLSRPVRHDAMMVRSRLLQKLNAAAVYRLVLITSPAGYGKTTLISQWAAEKRDLGWYSLDEGDNQPERFADYLIAALQQATQGSCSRSESLAQKRHYVNLNALFSQLFIELADYQRPAWLVIDDYHHITNPVIHEAMRFFLKHQPENLTLVVLSRGLPQLGIANLRVREQLLELSSQQLAFTHDEAKQFFDNRLQAPLPGEESDQLCDDVAGWATALQLIAISARQGAGSAQDSARRLSGINASHLTDYLVEEVLDTVDADTRQFLLKSALLRSMNDALVTSVTGEDNGRMRLEEIERQGLFLQRMDNAGEWFSYHPLFGSFLRQRCQWELSAELPALHRAAARGWMRQGFPGEAIHHALASGDTDMLRDVLLEHAWTLFNQSELALLESSLRVLPWPLLLENPELVLLQAWLMQSQHRFSEVNSLLAQFEQQRCCEMDASLQGELHAIRAQVAINDGNAEEAAQLARLALQLLPASKSYSRIVATSVHGEVMHCKGELADSLALMRQTEQMARQEETWHYVLWSLIQQSEILFAQGFLQSAWEMQEKAFRLVHEQHLAQFPLHEFLLRIRAQLFWAWGRLDEAEQAARSGMQVLRGFPPQQQIQCLGLLIQCSLARGNLDNARSHITRLENLLNNGTLHIDWIANADKARILYWQLTGDSASASQWLRVTSRPASANNHFLQEQWRNVARAQLLAGDLIQAEVILDELNENARTLQLTSDFNSNLLLLNQLYWQTNRKPDAQRVLIAALKLARSTGFMSQFVIEGEIMAQQLRQLLQLSVLEEIDEHRARRILHEINKYHRHKFAHFDEGFVSRLLNHPDVPELVRTSPLTQREWQVLGLIYSGYSNEQIAGELDVAATTIKTHIRNLYQKLGVTHRNEAMHEARSMLRLMGYV
ncbi:HTH-type transcriptional regulator MalT [Pantoea eucrina]|uniref:HTH-type transcriptional regulator MalT n=1 Tax=Pantoea eucrina TaxID=472693 RepID=A0ABS1Z531_9GAMM|nr:HTH-type transcriptional regulator MalT [Pantoea eucrina]MBM0747536.1 HTH-type transcriptional regulator MalT [Pantoea eucrina]